MNSSHARLRRLILGMSVEDAHSKFDSPESRTILRVAHERYNQGILHELQIAQQQWNRMPPEKRCRICRFTKPSVKGFQGYIKYTPDDYVVVEQWDNNRLQTSSSNSVDSSPRDSGGADSTGSSLEAGPKATPSSSAALAHAPSVSAKLAEEKSLFSRSMETVLETLRDALDNVKNNVLMELADRRQRGALIAGRQPSVVDRLVDESSELADKGYKTLSSSTHLLEPVEMELVLFAKKDKEIADAFKCPLLTVPASEGDISYSLWVAGGLIADDEAAAEFPYHIAKYVVGGDANHGANRLPRVDVEVYFSPELYQLQRSIGKQGIVALRKFIGATMMRQHEPTPVSSSILLSVPQGERELMNLYDPAKIEAIRIPWVRTTRSTISTITGVAFNVQDAVEESATIEGMKDSVGLVWRAWGHLIKDLHVHGDLDYLYVAIDRKKEASDNAQYIQEVRLLAEAAGVKDKDPLMITDSSAKAPGSAPANRKRGAGATQKQTFFCPVAADFTVIECLLERKGLPHNMVMEDITAMLTEMQSQSLEMMRLAVVDAYGQEESTSPTPHVVPLLYSPKIVVSHAGVIENRTHSFQRIRIRGSTLAHVEALISALKDSDYFTSRADGGTASWPQAASQLALPKNLTFSATHEQQTAALLQRAQRSRGHSGSAGAERSSSGRFLRHQTTQALDFMTVSDDELAFWKENYYRLSDPKTLFQDRVDPADLGLGAGAGAPRKPSARLMEHLRLVTGKLAAGVDDDASGAGEAGLSPPARGKKARRGSKKKPLDIAQIPVERLFEYLCTDMEAETSMYDLRVGDCSGYAYRVNVRKIPSKQIPLVPAAVQSVAAKGFINYFGLNRFASYTKMDMHPGLHLLKGEFSAAAHVIVQQFYVDIATEAEKRRTGTAFPQPLGIKGTKGFHLNDFARRSQRSIAESGTALQKVLSNALQASLLMSAADGDADAALDGDANLSLTVPPAASAGRRAMGLTLPGAGGLDGRGITSFAEMIDTDPCADAFLNVIGPNACHILIHEFLSVLWNDIVNQRLQRYGTFAILPGDLVRKHPTAPRGSAAFAELTRATRREIATGARTHWDVVLPIPGANVELPENHTADLYVVTLKRMGLHFNPEARQWGCFYPRQWTASEPARGGAHGGVPLASPYRFLSTSHQLMEEELGGRTPFTESLPRDTSLSATGAATRAAAGEVLFDPESDASGSGACAGMAGSSLFDAGGLRPDLQRQDGNPLNLLVEAGYRHPLFHPGDGLRWQLHRGAIGDPHQRWGAQRGEGQRHRQRQHDAQRRPAEDPAGRVGAPPPAGLTVGSYVPGSGAAGRPQLVLPDTNTAHAPFAERQVVPAAARPTMPSRWRGRRLPIPPTPYWLPSHDDAHLVLDFELPTGTYASMLLRELTKLDVNSPDVVDLDRSLVESRRARSWDALTADQQEVYRKYMTKRRQRAFGAERPQAISLALLHQQIFRSGGVRGSLIPTLRSYDSVSK